ncbi:MAG TPA: YkgJ family cysteine cluster protein [Polyangiaceae bacterium]
MRRPVLGATSWRSSPFRAELLALYARADQALASFTCDTSTECCRFGVTGREPYVTPVELAEIEHAAAARGVPLGTTAKRAARSLPLADDERRCAMLDDAGRCRIYQARPLGCRTFFCERAVGPGKLPREEVQRIVRELASLAARHSPRAPEGRPLTRIFESRR